MVEKLPEDDQSQPIQQSQSEEQKSEIVKHDEGEDWKVDHQQRCAVFNEWCFSNGVMMPKVEYPAYFEGGLVGMQAKQPIEHRESFLSVPYKMLLTCERAQTHPVL